MKGLLIVCEGLDFSGKTTSMNGLVEDLRKEGFDAVYSPFSHPKTLFRAVLSVYKCTFLLIMNLIYTNIRFIKPALKKGKIVIQDRYIYSVIAYDKTKGNPLRILYLFLSRFIIKPNVIIFCNAPIQVLVKRAKERPKISRKDNLIINKKKFSIKVRKNMLKLIKRTKISLVVNNTAKKNIKENRNYLKEKIFIYLRRRQ